LEDIEFIPCAGRLADRRVPFAAEGGGPAWMRSSWRARCWQWRHPARARASRPGSRDPRVGSVPSTPATRR